MKQNKTSIVFAILLPLQILLVQWVSGYPRLIEQFYARGLYPYISLFFRRIFGWIPFSIGDLLIFGLFLFVLYFLIQIIRSKFKELGRKLLQIASFISILYGCFYLFWGFNYFREPLAKNLNFKSGNYTTTELIELNEKIVAQLNKAHSLLVEHDSLLVKTNYSAKEVYKIALLGYENLAKTHTQFTYTSTSIKSSLMSLLQTYNGTLGYLNPITGEAQVNDLIPMTSLPATTCHEMAHQLGWAAENEANFIGFLAATANTDVFFQYSGFRMAFSYAYSELRKRDPAMANLIWRKLHSGIVKDYRATSRFWSAYENPIEPYIKKGYNSYLKANNQDKGIDSYNYVVDLLISYYHQNTPKSS